MSTFTIACAYSYQVSMFRQTLTLPASKILTRRGIDCTSLNQFIMIIDTFSIFIVL